MCQDCLFDGVVSGEVDAVYANSAICGTLAGSYPAPRVTIRFCVFDHCQSTGTATFCRAAASITSSYFTSCGRSAVTAQDAAKVADASYYYFLFLQIILLSRCRSSTATSGRRS